MARKTKEETEQTRLRILDAALQEFSEKGFTRSTLNSIAARAGFTRGAVYWHFKDKVAVFAALAETMEQRSIARSWAESSGSVDSLDGLAEVFVSYLEFIEGDHGYQTFFYLTYFNTEWVEELSGVLDHYKILQQQTLRWTEQALSALGERGVTSKKLDVPVAALTLVSLNNGLLATWFTDRTAFSLSKEGSTAIRTLVASFC